MANYVVNTLLKDQKHLAPDIRSDGEVVLGVGSAELKMDVVGRKHIAGKLAHPLLQIVELVLGWIDGPYDVTHGIHQFPGDAGDPGQRLIDFGGSLADPPANHLAQDGHLREAGPDVVMQVGGNTSADALHGQQLLQAVAVEAVDNQRSQCRFQADKPPPLPDRCEDGKGRDSGPRTCTPVRTHGAYQEPILSRCKAREEDPPLICWSAPMFVTSFEQILIPEIGVLPKIEAEELDLDFIARGREIQMRQFGLTQL